MPHAERPQVTISGSAADPPADVIRFGADEARPRRRWPRAAVAVVLAAVVLGGALLTERGQSPPAGGPDAAPQQEDLRLVETGGDVTFTWGYGGRLDISLPVLVHNDGPAVTVASLALDGTALEQPAVDVALNSGGRLPVTLRQWGRCPEDVSVSRNAALRLEVRTSAGPDTHRLRLPDGAAESLAGALAQQCGAVPLEQALVLRSDEEQLLPSSVDLRVVADNIGRSELRLLSVEATTGLAVAVAPTPGADATTPSVALPMLLGEEPATFRLRVSVRDCAALAQVDKLDQAGVADITYDDAVGRRAGKAVAGDFPRLRDLVERTC